MSYKARKLLNASSVFYLSHQLFSKVSERTRTKVVFPNSKKMCVFFKMKKWFSIVIVASHNPNGNIKLFRNNLESKVIDLKLIYFGRKSLAFNHGSHNFCFDILWFVMRIHLVEKILSLCLGQVLVFSSMKNLHKVSSIFSLLLAFYIQRKCF